MSFKTILVYLESELKATHLLKAAVRIADQQGSHLIGTFIAHPLEPYVVHASEAAVSAEIIKIRMTVETERAERLEKLFDNATQPQNLVPEWRFDKNLLSNVSAAVMEQVRSVDVLLISAELTNTDNRNAQEHIAHIISHSSRPSIVVPEDYQDKSLGEFVFVAWDGSRESSRAIFDALPILKTAENVWLHRIKSKYEDKQHGDDVTIKLADSLARHGVKIEMSDSASSAQKVGEEILICAQDRGADCIVMGAYGHNRMHSFLIGGATRYVLEHSSVPLFMSH